MKTVLNSISYRCENLSYKTIKIYISRSGILEEKMFTHINKIFIQSWDREIY